MCVILEGNYRQRILLPKLKDLFIFLYYFPPIPSLLFSPFISFLVLPPFAIASYNEYK